MSKIDYFAIAGLAGRNDVVSDVLDSAVNIFFGPNGSGKTSLLRILHSALSNDATLLSNVPFSAAEISVHSSDMEGSYHFSIENKIVNKDERSSTDLDSILIASVNMRKKLAKPLEWKVTPDSIAIFHKYLPIARLYEGSQTLYQYAMTTNKPDGTEQALEARFADSLLRTWKDYSAEINSKVKSIQEEGLAGILRSVISKSESRPQSGTTDPVVAYQAVAAFLARRGMDDVYLSSDQFLRRYTTDKQLRSVARDIEDVERRISQETAPREALKQLIGEMFIGNKTLNLSDNEIEVEIGGKIIGLSTLSSGEKQLLKILVDTVIAGPSIVLIDEPELSMHIDWQRKLVSSIHLLNPHVQLIIATHSPEIMADVSDDRIHKI